MSKTFESTLENSSTGHLDQRFWFMQKTLCIFIATSASFLHNYTININEKKTSQITQPKRK